MTDLTKYAGLIDEHRDTNVDYNWWEYTQNEFVQILRALGFHVRQHDHNKGSDVKVYFTGFSCQGDGACFEARFDFMEQDPEPAFKALGISDETLQDYAQRLQVIYNLYGNVDGLVDRSSSLYYHSGTITFTIAEPWEDLWWGENNDLVDALEADIQEIARGLADWYYKQLESEYEHLISDEAVFETLEANDMLEEEAA